MNPNSPLIRPVPQDFIAEGKGFTVKAICIRWKCSQRTARRWQKAAGFKLVKDKKEIPMPADFVERARGKQLSEIVADLGYSKHVINRWRQQSGIDAPSRLPQVPIEKLRAMAKTMTVRAMAEECKVSTPSMVHILKSAGVAYGKDVRVIKQPGRMSPIEKATKNVLNATAQYAKDWIQRQEPIWRCREDGVYDFTGSYFRFRGRVWDAAALVEKARDMGWSETRAWSVAA